MLRTGRAADADMEYRLIRGIIPGAVEADGEPIEMLMACREPRQAGERNWPLWMTMQVNHSSVSRRPRFVTKLATAFNTSAANMLTGDGNAREKRNKIVSCCPTPLVV